MDRLRLFAVAGVLSSFLVGCVSSQNASKYLTVDLTQIIDMPEKYVGRLVKFKAMALRSRDYYGFSPMPGLSAGKGAICPYFQPGSNNDWRIIGDQSRVRGHFVVEVEGLIGFRASFPPPEIIVTSGCREDLIVIDAAVRLIN